MDYKTISESELLNEYSIIKNKIKTIQKSLNIKSSIKNPGIITKLESELNKLKQKASYLEAEIVARNLILQCPTCG